MNRPQFTYDETVLPPSPPLLRLNLTKMSSVYNPRSAALLNLKDVIVASHDFLDLAEVFREALTKIRDLQKTQSRGR